MKPWSILQTGIIILIAVAACKCDIVSRWLKEKRSVIFDHGWEIRWTVPSIDWLPFLKQITLTQPPTLTYKKLWTWTISNPALLDFWYQLFPSTRLAFCFGETILIFNMSAKNQLRICMVIVASGTLMEHWLVMYICTCSEIMCFPAITHSSEKCRGCQPTDGFVALHARQV